MLPKYKGFVNHFSKKDIYGKVRAFVTTHPRHVLDLHHNSVSDSIPFPIFQNLSLDIREAVEIAINSGVLEKPAYLQSDSNIPKPSIHNINTENRTEPANMSFNEILAECQTRAKTKTGNCTHKVVHDARMDKIPLGIYHITHSRDKHVLTSDFERAGFSIMPTRSNGKPTAKFRQFWDIRRRAKDWNHKFYWRNAYGIQIFTGEASRKKIDGVYHYPACWDIEEDLLLEHEDVFKQITEWAITIPNTSLIISKSGGLRINAWVPFIRDRRDQMVARREWINDNGKIKGTTYAEILSGKGLARIDERYLLARGRIDEWAVMTEEEFLKPLEWVISLDARIRKQTEPREANFALDEDLPDGLTWKQGDIFLISTQRYNCEQDHKSNPTCEYRKHKSGTITKWCWACKTCQIIRQETINTEGELQQKEIRKGNLSPLALRRKPVKLDKEENNQLNSLLVNWNIARQHIAAVLRSTERVFAFRSDTGTGKNYQTETYAIDTGPILQTEPHTDLAIDLENRMHNRLTENGLPHNQVFRYRGLMHQWNEGKDAHLRFPQEIPCIQAGKCDAYRRKGGNMYKAICSSCPEKQECEENGYLSQPKHAQLARMVITPHKDIHINPVYSQHIERYLTDYLGQQRVIIQDEAQAHELFIECQTTRDQLLEMVKHWKGEELGRFAKILVDYCDDDNPRKIGQYIAELASQQKKDIKQQLTRVRFLVKDGNDLEYHRIMELDKAVAEGYFSITNENEINKLPSVYHPNWTLLDQLETFFEHYKREVDAPIRYHNGVLQWAIPPRLHKKVKKAGFMSATLDLNLFKRAFPNAHTEQIPPTHWAAGAKVYQLRTNRNPRSTVYKMENNKPTGLNPTGEKFWQRMMKEIRNTPDKKHAIITYIQLLEWKMNEVASDLTEHENIVTTRHYRGLTGLDTDFKEVDVLWVLFAPEIPSYEKEWVAKKLYGNDDEPLNYQRDKETGKYIDQRLQNISDNLVIGELIQAVGRVRLILRARTIVILSSHYLPNITDRTETRLFDEADWDIAGGLENIDATITQREKAEKHAAELTGDNSIADFQEAFGCSKRHARRLRDEKKNKKSRGN